MPPLVESSGPDISQRGQPQPNEVGRDSVEPPFKLNRGGKRRLDLRSHRNIVCDYSDTSGISAKILRIGGSRSPNAMLWRRSGKRVRRTRSTLGCGSAALGNIRASEEKQGVGAIKKFTIVKFFIASPAAHPAPNETWHTRLAHVRTFARPRFLVMDRSRRGASPNVCLRSVAG